MPDLRRSITRGYTSPPPAACCSIIGNARRIPTKTWKYILVWWQIDSVLAVHRLSISELETIDLAFNSYVRRYVAQLASHAGLPPALVQNLFPIKVRYGIDERYVAALLSNPEHLLELAPNGESDLTY